MEVERIFSRPDFSIPHLSPAGTESMTNGSPRDPEDEDAMMDDICSLSAEEFERYTVGERMIGHGAFGDIINGHDEVNDCPVAIKIQNKQIMTTGQFEAVRNECRFLSQLDHPNVIKLHGGHDDGIFMYWVMHLMTGGDMLDYVQHHGPLSEESARNFFAQLVEAIDHCHQRNIIHRDIKLENILIQKSQVNPLECMISVCDFGFATYQEPNGPGINTFPGSPHYAAPELIYGRPYQGRATDIWAMGICLYAMVTGIFPFGGKTTDEIFNSIIIDDIPMPGRRGRKSKQKAKYSWSLYSLLIRILSKSSRDRITMDQIKEHKWMQSVNFRAASSD